MTFRTRLFATSVAASAATLLVATLLISWSLKRTLEEQIERTLVTEARLAAEALSHRRPASRSELDAEADVLGTLGSARVTFIAPEGTVIGDSEVGTAELPAVENHAARPEVQQAFREGVGIARRYSVTVGTDMLYVAVRVPEGGSPDLSIVRLALPLTEIEEQLAAVRQVAVIAFGVGTLIALGLSWVTSTLLVRRMHEMAAAAERYAAGDFSRPARDRGKDEIGKIGRVLDDAVRELAERATELASDRARMEAILGGMIEGVLVVDEHGRLQLVNGAARRMLRIDGAPEGRHYLEIVRHPDIAAQIGDDDLRAVHVKLGRDSDGRPVDALHVHGHAPAEESRLVEKAIWNGLQGNEPLPERLGELEPGVRSEPVALTQLLLLAHLLAM